LPNNLLEYAMSSENSRREFLKRASALSATGVVAPWALNLAAIGEAAAQSSPTDYKALVCVFLFGGNDHGNTLVPYDLPTWKSYAELRGGSGTNLAAPGGLGTAWTSLKPTLLDPVIPLPGGSKRQYALAPEMSQLIPVFDKERLAVLLNIGPLIGPTTKKEYVDRSVSLPPKLFSHNDQQSVWQASNPEGAISGWGGRIGDPFVPDDPTKSTFTAVSVSGNAVFLSGKDTVQYQVSTSGSVRIKGIGDTESLYGSLAAGKALRKILRDTPSFNNFEIEYARVVLRSIEADRALTDALNGVPALVTEFPTTGLAAQLKMVARMISAREATGVKRQVFFVSLGGFDLHDNLLAAHGPLLKQVGDAMASFDTAMKELDVLDQVTTFTASDFGRTLTSNGDGSDHGWGSYHFVMGGAVNGKRFFGEPPVLGNDGPDDVGQGRMLPTMAVDQLAATLATWMGVPPDKLEGVAPSIKKYPIEKQNLGLFRSSVLGSS
jgi:uncharacterized protein (DUF1501 family)